MKLSWILFGLLLAMWLVLGGTLLLTSTEHPRGILHRKITDSRIYAAHTVGLLGSALGQGPVVAASSLFPDRAMDQSGVDLAKRQQLMWFGWGFGSLQIIFFTGVLLLGVREDRRRKLIVPLLIGGALFLAVFAAMILTYHGFLTARTVAFLGPFPATTTLMVIGLWVIPFYFVLLYVFVFYRSIYTGQDAETFRQLLLNRQQVEGEND